MLLLLVFDFDDTLGVSNYGEGSGTRADRIMQLSEQQKFQKSSVIFDLESKPRRSEGTEINQVYPLGVACMSDLMDALNDNPGVMGKSVFIYVLSKGKAIPESVKGFFEKAYRASPDVTQHINVVNPAFPGTTGFIYGSDKAQQILDFIAFFNSSRAPQNSLEATITLSQKLLPSQAYLFDDDPPNVTGAIEKGICGVDSRSSQFFVKIHEIAALIRNKASLEAGGWNLV